MVTLNEPRLPAAPSQLIDRSSPVTFEFNGRQVEAFEGDTVASALYASGVRIFSRSFKYHRARGLLCVAGRCPNCLMTVDGVPNVRACTEPARPGMTVRHQNAWPSLDRDFLSIFDRLDRLLPIGFYYKAFHHPKWAWSVASKVIRRVAGLGSVDTGTLSDRRYHHEFRHVDVAVVGGGVAGMSAALAAVEQGASVMLIDDQPTLGAADNTSRATTLSQQVKASAIEVFSPATVFGLYEGNLLAVLTNDGVIKLRARRIVASTGSYETPLAFDRNDIPGVMLSTGVQRLMHMYGIRPGRTAVVATTTDQGYHAALDMLEAGVRIAALADSRPGFRGDLEVAVTLQSRGVLILTSHALTRAEGMKKVLGGVVARLRDGVVTTEERQFDCDLIATSGGFQLADSLLAQAGAASRYEQRLDQMVPEGLPPGIYAAGGVTGIRDEGASALQGRLAGVEAAASLTSAAGPDRINAATLRRQVADAETASLDRNTVSIPPIEPGRGVRKFVCFCEDVTGRDLVQGIDEGFEDVQTLKRYSTATMGPCQGKMCHQMFARISAERTGRDLAETGSTTSRPPIQPVSLGALAGPSHMPIKRTSMDQLHRSLGATIIDSNQWQRPQMYGSPQEECLAVRNRVGIIDVSTLGKLDVQGKDAPALLDKVYTHHFSTLRPGRIRYGLLCADNGSIMDDGTVTRLADDHYFVTTSTANVEVIEEWFKWWLAGTGMCAHVTNITAGLSAINVAGPNARDTLSKLTDVDLSPRGFRYMRSKRGEVAGVPTIFLRIGFVGEAGWEVHFPSEYGEYMWNALMDAGEEFGIAPFGTEAQRILRLEKKHIIPSQDTDLLSNPLDSDAEWAVRFDKEDFIGRGGLAAAQARDAQEKLVGFVVRDGIVPRDGDAVVSRYRPVGRVTSSRLSPTLGKGFGLAWVPAELAKDGTLIHIRVEGQLVPADVVLEPVYDPDGERLRS